MLEMGLLAWIHYHRGRCVELMEKMWSGFQGVLSMFQNDRSWIECVKFIENSSEIYQVLYSHPYSCEPWMITFDLL